MDFAHSGRIITLVFEVYSDCEKSVNSCLLLLKSTFELIGSEASYLRSLGVAVNHFCASKALRKTLNQMEHHILFSNIRRVMAASEK